MDHAILEAEGAEFDFGVSCSNLTKMDIWEVPVDVVDSRPDIVPKPTVVRMDVSDFLPKGKAKEAAIAEVVPEPSGLTFEYDGETYTIPKPEDWDVEIFEAEEDGKIITTVRALLGPEQWLRFKSKPRNMSALNDLFTTATQATGTKVGE